MASLSAPSKDDSSPFSRSIASTVLASSSNGRPASSTSSSLRFERPKLVQNAALSLVNGQHRLELSNLTREQRELFAFYEARLESFEAEREDFIKRVLALEGSVSERQSLQLAKINNSFIVAELQRSLSEAECLVQEKERETWPLAARLNRCACASSRTESESSDFCR